MTSLAVNPNIIPGAFKEIYINPDKSTLVFSVNEDKEKDGKEATVIVRRKSISTKQFISKLNQKEDELFLPQNTRFICEKDGYKFIVIEEPPQIRTINVEISQIRTVERLKETGRFYEYGYNDDFLKTDPVYQFTLSFPYIIYVLTFNQSSFYSLSIFYRLSPLSSLSDYLIKPNLHNINGRYNNVCLGSINISPTTFAINCNEVIDSWWMNKFNPDYFEKYELYNNVEGITDYLTWQYNTNIDPMFIFKVDWIPYKHTIGHFLNLLQKEYLYSHNNMRSYSDLLQIFYNKDSVQLKNNQITDNICDSRLFSNIEICVGEEIKFENGTKWYVESFLGQKRSNPTHVKLENINGKQYIFKITKEFENFIIKQFRIDNSLQSTTLQNGVTVSVGDIIEITKPFHAFKKVQDIRIARDGKIELLFHKYYFLADVLEAKVISLDSFTLNGIVFEKGREYYLYENGNRNLMKSTLTNFDISSQTGDLKLLFQTTFSGLLSVDWQDITNNNIFIIDGAPPLAPLVFRKDFTILDNVNKNFFKIGNKIISTNVDYKHSLSIENICNQLLQENSIVIPSEDNELKYEIGEEVVVSDWDNPENMLKIKTIKEFTVTDSLNVILEDEAGIQECISFIVKPQRSSENYQILLGKIRKISKFINGIPIKTKIHANITGISNFPKKDTNEIVAFIIDSDKEPLVLCSNCCTLWFSELENFNLILPDEPSWSKFEVAPIELNKIKLQPGDLVLYEQFETQIPFITYERSGHSYELSLLRCLVFSDINFNNYRHFSGIRFNKNTVRPYGFLTPRYPISKIQYDFSKRPGKPDGFGLIYEDSNSSLYFRTISSFIRKERI